MGTYMYKVGLGLVYEVGLSWYAAVSVDWGPFGSCP